MSDESPPPPSEGEPDPSPEAVPDSSPESSTQSNSVPSSKSSKSERDFAMFTHLAGLVCLLGVPSLLGPLVCWLIKKDSMPLVDEAGKEAMNFHLTMLIVQVVSVPLVLIGVGFITLFAAMALSIIFSIIGGIEANKGTRYVYPFSWRLIK